MIGCRFIHCLCRSQEIGPGHEGDASQFVGLQQRLAVVECAGDIELVDRGA